jgi:host factor-I protein
MPPAGRKVPSIVLRLCSATWLGSRSSARRFVYNACMSFPRPPQGNPNNSKRSRTPPPEDTFEEAAFLKALGEKQRPVSVKLMDGQIVHGWVEYYDKNMVRLTREHAPNLFIFKHEIMYIMEDGGKRK